MNIINKVYKDDEFMAVAGSILEHKEFSKTKEIVHHGSTRYNHSIKVAYIAYKLSKLVGCDTKATIRGGMLHDFFLERDDKSILSESKMWVKHPTIAKENAIKYFNVDIKEQNIIEAHMFPLSNVTPKYKESWIVTFSDKLASGIDVLTTAKAQIAIWIGLLTNIIK